MSIKTRKLAIKMNQGDDFNLVLLIKDAGGPVNLTGYDFFGEMKLDTSAETPIAAEFIFTILNQTYNKGQVQWSLSNETTISLSTSVSNNERKKRLTTPYVFDVKMIDTSSKISRVVEGVIYLSPQVTQEI